MINVSRDQNSVTAMVGVLNTDGVTPTMPQADPNLHSLEINDGTTGTVTANAWAGRDQNSVHVLLAIADDGSGTLVELAVDSSGNLLIQST